MNKTKPLFLIIIRLGLIRIEFKRKTTMVKLEAGIKTKNKYDQIAEHTNKNIGTPVVIEFFFTYYEDTIYAKQSMDG